MAIAALLDLKLAGDTLPQAGPIIHETLEVTRAFAGCISCDVLVDAVHDLVVRAVAAEDVEALDAAPQGCGEVGGVPRPLCEERLHHQAASLQLPLDCHGQLGRHPRRARVDDQGRVGHGATVVAPGT